jgi:hypothetical protein
MGAFVQASIDIVNIGSPSFHSCNAFPCPSGHGLSVKFACRLVYDEYGNFDSYDGSAEDEADYYDYEDAHIPGCSAGVTSDSLLNSNPNNARAANVTVNKSTFWPIPNSDLFSGSINCVMEVVPYMCAPIPARVATSAGNLFPMFPTPAIIIACVFGVVIIFSLIVACLGCLSRLQ